MKAFGPDAMARIRYFDTDQQSDAIKLLPNEYYVVGPKEPSLMLTTVLGSCVAACLHDPVTGVGGMNHFMLPGDAQSGSSSMRYGAYAMEVLINEILKAGAVRERLQAKVFGGGAVLGTMTRIAIGDDNAEFILDYLRQERIPVVAQDLRGTLPRRVNYFPSTGQAKVRKLGSDPQVQGQVIEQETALRTFLNTAAPKSGRIERLQPRARPVALPVSSS